MNRRIIGFEINPQLFNFHYSKLEKIKPGNLLDSVRKGKNNKPKNQRKAWSTDELSKLKIRFIELKATHKTKKKSIEILQKEFGRGYFSILNKIDEF